MKFFSFILIFLLFNSCIIENKENKETTSKDFYEHYEGISTEIENVIIWKSFWRFRMYREGVTVVKDTLSGLYGFMSDGGDRPAIPCMYLYASNFNGDLALVRDAESKKYGYINRMNEVVVPFIYDDAYSFNRGMLDDCEGFYGLAIVNIGNPPEKSGMLFTEGKWGLINRKGEVVLPIKYDYIFPISYGVAFILEGVPIEEKKSWEGRFGIVDAGGKILVSPIYDKVPNAFVFEDRVITVEKDGKEFKINTMGKVVE